MRDRRVSYDVTVKGIKHKSYPERDAEFAKQLGNYESWDDFETKLREHAGGSQEGCAGECRRRTRCWVSLIQRFQFPVPESFVQQQIDARLDRGLRALAQQGMSVEDMRKLDFARLREAQRDQAINEVKASMILDRIAEAEGVTVSDERCGSRAADAFDSVARAAGGSAREVVARTVGWTGFASRCGARRQEACSTRSWLRRV